MDERKRAELLWQLLDNIDTLDDSCRSDDAAFRRLARKHLNARHELLTSDGRDLHTPGGGPCGGAS